MKLVRQEWRAKLDKGDEAILPSASPQGWRRYDGREPHIKLDILKLTVLVYVSIDLHIYVYKITCSPRFKESTDPYMERIP